MQAVFTQTDKKIEVADLSKRLIAICLDLAILFTIIGVIDYLTFSSNEQALLLKPERILAFILGWLYFAGMETCACQATLGKYLAGLKVTRKSGERISFKDATIRYFTRPVSAIQIVLSYTSSKTPISQNTFHDKLSHSIVVVC